jgi:hypothetical protein
VFALRRNVITFSVRLSDEEQALLNKLINRYGRTFPVPKTFNGLFRAMIRNIDKRPWENAFQEEEPEKTDDPADDRTWLVEEAQEPGQEEAEE